MRGFCHDVECELTLSYGASWNYNGDDDIIDVGDSISKVYNDKMPESKA